MNRVASCDQWPLIARRQEVSYDTVLAVKMAKFGCKFLGFVPCDQWPLIARRQEVSYDTVLAVKISKDWML